jgi:transposase
LMVEELMRFVLRLRDGESIASLCREFDISRVTGYKIFDRYKQCGLEGLTDRARAPYSYANKLPEQLEAMIVSMRREKPTWGARKLRDRLLRKLPNDVRVPACSTIQAILERRGAGDAAGDRKTMAVCDRHDFTSFSAASRADSRAPFFAELKLASMKVSDRSSLPRTRRSSASVCNNRVRVPSRCHC